MDAKRTNEQILEFGEKRMGSRLAPELIEQMAVEIRGYLIEKQLWIDTTIYFNGKAFSTNDRKGHFAYNDPNDLIILENENPRDYFEYVGPILSMSFEGPLCDCINGYGEYERSFEDKVVRELRDIFEKYGCYYEQGHHWNLTLYRI